MKGSLSTLLSRKKRTITAVSEYIEAGGEPGVVGAHGLLPRQLHRDGDAGVGDHQVGGDVARGVRTPVTLPSSTIIFSTGVLRRTVPPNFSSPRRKAAAMDAGGALDVAEVGRVEHLAEAPDELPRRGAVVGDAEEHAGHDVHEPVELLVPGVAGEEVLQDDVVLRLDEGVVRPQQVAEEAEPAPVVHRLDPQVDGHARPGHEGADVQPLGIAAVLPSHPVHHQRGRVLGDEGELLAQRLRHADMGALPAHGKGVGEIVDDVAVPSVEEHRPPMKELRSSTSTS